MTKALKELDHTITADSNPGYVESHTKALEDRAKLLIGAAAGGNIAAAGMIRDTLAGTKAGRDSLTGQTQQQGDQDARRKAVADQEQKWQDDEKSRVAGIADEFATGLAKRFGGLYGLHGASLSVADVKDDLIKSGVSQELADRISVDVWKKVQAGLDKRIREHAVEHGTDLATAEYQLRGQIDQRDPADIARAKAIADANEAKRKAMQQRIDAHAATSQSASNAQMGRFEAASGLADPVRQAMMDARLMPLMDPRRQQRMTPRERMEHLRNTTPAMRKAEAADRARPMTFEETEQARAKQNAETDAALEKQITATLLGEDGQMVRGHRVGNSRAMTDDRLYASGVAHDLVSKQRKELDGKTGDQPIDKNTATMKDLGERMKSLEEQMKKGVAVQLAP